MRGIEDAWCVGRHYVGCAAEDALAKLHAAGWTDASLRAGGISVAFDLWRAVAVGYASAYGRYAFDAHPCGYRYSAQNVDTSPRAATPAERAAWWADAPPFHQARAWALSIHSP